MNRSCELPKQKKPYEPPKLIVYGSLAEMTLSAGGRGQPDHGRLPRHQQTGKGGA